MRTRFVLWVVLLSAMVFSREATANMAQAVTSGDQFGALVPQRTTAVRVDRETLSFDLHETLGSARVRAVYRMTSGAEPSSADVAFVVAGDSREHDLAAAITADGAPVPFRTVRADDTAVPRAEVEAMTRAWSTLGAPEHLTWLVFRLDFAAAQTREISVTYTHTASDDRASRVNSTYGYDYLLSPAKAWASFGPIEISVRAPPDVLLTSNMPLVRQGDTYRATLPGLPAGELRFEVMSKAGLWLGMTTSGGYWAIVIITIMGAAIAAGAATGGFWRHGSHRKRAIMRTLFGGGIAFTAAAVVAVALSAVLPNHALGFGYGGFFGVVLLVLLACPVGIIASFTSAGRRDRAA